MFGQERRELEEKLRKAEYNYERERMRLEAREESDALNRRVLNELIKFTGIDAKRYARPGYNHKEDILRAILHDLDVLNADTTRDEAYERLFGEGNR